MNGRFLTGTILVLLGVGFLLQQAHVWDFSDILSNCWPLILVIVGIAQLFNRNSTSLFSGFIFIVAGILFFINNLIDINLYLYFWPLILIIAGVSFFFSRGTHRAKPISDDATNSFSIFGGQNIQVTSSDYEGGQVTAIFGGAEIDLRDAVISEQGAVLELNAVFGGVKIYVPENAKVQVSGLPIFGGCENKTRKRAITDAPLLKINYAAVFGGVEIRD
ncbi:DUF5668 domain-containing protein [Aciduricibacillus chroicocephali]|uniref:DUF5668 domain-containing protein n=1 Tax=Aciduricibacillus chroicocephali TaxID=3054939 RepID=A0ABY9KUT2_9BACI|nr:DUF5668 domain-containing protein [Bacillaceae bacterium 44XB]